nr:MAG TPA: hypothetical protein [Caudoviricetes sp.]DAZ11743.1 MAG TPA: hypothetical protein [Caudoviricetes sp.]
MWNRWKTPECKVRLLAIRLIPAINSPIVERKKALGQSPGA